MIPIIGLLYADDFQEKNMHIVFSKNIFYV
jgi:hypothetical protein